MISIQNSAFVISLLVFLSCNFAETENRETSVNSTSGDYIGISFTPKVMPSTLKANGVLDVPPDHKATISAQFEGYVKAIQVIEGDWVNKGDLLFTLENPAYIKIQKEYLEALAERDFRKENFERQQTLYDEKIASEKSYLEAKSRYEKNSIAIKSLRKELEMMGVDPDQVSISSIFSTIQVRSIIQGYVTQIKIHRGIFLNPDDEALVILDPSHLHLELTFFESEFNLIRKGQVIQFSVSGRPKDTLRAEVFVLPGILDPESKSATVHGHIHPADQEKLVPGSFVEASIEVGADTLWTVPEKAITYEKGRSAIWVLDKQSQLMRKQGVELGREGREWVEVLNYKDFERNDSLMMVFP
jgi:cobalt-zinc-cadmium efflux system membrane fusion protein